MKTTLTFDIPYIRLRFRADMVEDTYMPMDKESALRGGLGEMLLRQNCVSDRDCETCRFNQVCVVRHTFYSPMEKKPDYVTGKESVGYLIECLDKRTEFEEGSSFEFTLLLFGNSIAFFNIYLQAFCQLGMVGLGKNKSRFQIAEVLNTRGKKIIRGNEVDMSRYQVETVKDYVLYRKEEMKKKSGSWEVRFLTPLSMKYQQNFMEKFYAEALVQGAVRRMHMLNYYMGIDAEMPVCTEYPTIEKQTVKKEYRKRYSGTQDSRMTLWGITGRMIFKRMPEECLDYLIAGELTHMGKNTSFGFGKYVLCRGEG